MRMYRLADFQTWCVDFEYGIDANKRQRPIHCMVARQWGTSRGIRCWGEELYARRQAPFPVDARTVLVTYSGIAELRAFMELNWALPVNVFDAFVEFRLLANGRSVPAGYSLLGALSAFGLDAMDAAEKADLQALALRGPPFTAQEQRSLLEYCRADVLSLERLLTAMEPHVDVARALWRGRFVKAAARVAQAGIPIDGPLFASLHARWGTIKTALIAAVDGSYGVYDRGSFRAARWLGWCQAHGVPWPQLPSGVPKLDRETFQQMADDFPDVYPMLELRAAMGQMKATGVTAGPDARVRAWPAPFMAKTGRCAPPSSEFLFGASAWLRHVIQAPPGYGVGYIDYGQQEIGVAAALSADPALIAAYQSGDCYLAFARQVGAIPPDGTKASHGTQRELFKACMLAMGYGAGEELLARRLRIPLLHARELIRLHRATYRQFWRWIEGEIEDAYARGYIETVFGWRLAGVTPYRKRQGRVSGTSRRTLQNYPAQGNGAEVLRAAACLLTEHGIEVNALVHDAVLLTAPLSELDEVLAEAQRLMGKASEVVLSGFRLRTEAAIYRHPEHYQDAKGAHMWGRVQRLLNQAR
jgi:DNA polymerase family A